MARFHLTAIIEREGADYECADESEVQSRLKDEVFVNRSALVL